MASTESMQNRIPKARTNMSMPWKHPNTSDSQINSRDIQRNLTTFPSQKKQKKKHPALEDSPKVAISETQFLDHQNKSKLIRQGTTKEIYRKSLMILPKPDFFSIILWILFHLAPSPFPTTPCHPQIGTKISGTLNHPTLAQEKNLITLTKTASTRRLQYLFSQISKN